MSSSLSTGSSCITFERRISGSSVPDHKVHVAVGSDEVEGRSLLSWASVNFQKEEVRFVLLHVLQLMTPEEFKLAEEQRNAPLSELLVRYKQFCDLDLKFQPDFAVTVNIDIEAGILHLIESHMVTRLVMGGSDYRKTNKKPKTSRWSTSTYVCNNAKLFCKIFVISESELIFVREAHQNPLELPDFLPIITPLSEKQIHLPKHLPLYKNAPILYGIESHYKSLVEKLLSSNFDENGIKVCCILAESGCGKTSLAHLVYNDPVVTDSFDTMIWLCNSKEMDINIFMRKIIEFITHVGITTTAPCFLKEIVEEQIRDKRLLIVMDDAYIEDHLFWNDTLSILNASANGSRLLITTNSNAVVSMVQPVLCCGLTSLSERHCSSIMKQCSGSYYYDIKSFSKKIFVLSGGLPLYVKALSGYLCHAEEHDLLLIDSLKEKKILTLALCFSRLPQHLKRFCTFCSLFPKGYIFVKYLLVGLWVALDYSELTKRGEPENVAMEDFNDLFSRSFFQNSSFHGFGEEKYVMHEVIYDLAKKVDWEDNYISINVSQGMCYLYVNAFDYKTLKLSQVTDGIVNLESLVTASDFSLQDHFMSFPTLQLEGLDDLIFRNPGLILLDLSYTCMEILPASVCLLKNLRHLAVNCTEIKCLPPEIGSMKELLTLQAKDCRFLFELPESVTCLKNLRHLDVRKEFDNVSMPAGFGQLINIQTLEVFSVGSDPKHCSIGELKNLESLRGSIKITGLEHVKDAILARQANLLNKRNLKYLTLQWHNCMNSEEKGYISGDGPQRIAGTSQSSGACH